MITKSYAQSTDSGNTSGSVHVMRCVACCSDQVAAICCKERAWEETLEVLREMREQRGYGEPGESYDEAVEACMNGKYHCSRVMIHVLVSKSVPVSCNTTYPENRACTRQAFRA